MTGKRIKVLVAKPGLDGHDHGAKVVVRALMAAGFEVFYTGLRQTPESIADAAAAHDVDVVGLSSMAGTHMQVCRELRPLLRERGLGERMWIIGGVIPEQDREPLKALGLDAVFPMGTEFEAIVKFIEEGVK